jgi:hypothetical protein
VNIGFVALLRIFKFSWLGFVLFCWTMTLANAAFDGFEAGDGYDSRPNKTLIGLPNPGVDEIFSGPWQNVSTIPNTPDANFQSSGGPNSQVYQGQRTFELKRGTSDQGYIEAVRPMLPYSGGLANPIQEVSVYAYIPGDTKNSPNSVVGLYLFSALGSPLIPGNESASFTARAAPSGTTANWYVWDANQYKDTGIEVQADTWVKLTLEVNLATQIYIASVNNTDVTSSGQTLSGEPLNFGANSSANLTGLAFGMSNTASANRSVFFDSLTVKPRVPELQSWLTVLGMVGAGLLPFSLRTRR